MEAFNIEDYKETMESVDDFYWYKKELDVRDRCWFSHGDNVPRKYPCRVASYCPGGSAYYHQFVYQIELTCTGCGQKMTVWPGEGDAQAFNRAMREATAENEAIKCGEETIEVAPQTTKGAVDG
jgi:hypothetical protein